MWRRLRARPEWRFFAVLPKADLRLTVAWWLLLIAGGALPAVFAVATGLTVGRGRAVDVAGRPAGLDGDRVRRDAGPQPAAHRGEHESRQPGVGVPQRAADPRLRHPARHRSPRGPGPRRGPDRGAGVRPRADRAADVVQRRLRRQRTGRAGGRGVVGDRAGRFRLVGARSCCCWPGARPTGCCGRAGSGRTARPRRSGRPSGTPTTRTGWRWIRNRPRSCGMFGLAGWVVDRFRERRRELFELQYRATRLRERSVGLCLLIVGVANLAVFGALGWAAMTGELTLERLVVFAQVALGVSQVAFGGLNWALDGASAPVAAVERLEPAMAPLGALPRRLQPPPPRPRTRAGAPRRRVPLSGQRPADLHRSRSRPCPPAPRWPSSARTGPARPPWPSCSAGCTTPTPARSRWRNGTRSARRSTWPAGGRS